MANIEKNNGSINGGIKAAISEAMATSA